MRRESNALKTIVLLIGLLAPAAVQAESMEKAVVAQLKQQGFLEFSVERTLLGRIRIVAESRQLEREIVLNPTTGEILRDYWKHRPSEAPAPTTANPHIFVPGTSSSSGQSVNYASSSSGSNTSTSTSTSSSSTGTNRPTSATAATSTVSTSTSTSDSSSSRDDDGGDDDKSYDDSDSRSSDRNRERHSEDNDRGKKHGNRERDNNGGGRRGGDD